MGTQVAAMLSDEPQIGCILPSGGLSNIMWRQMGGFGKGVKLALGWAATTGLTCLLYYQTKKLYLVGFI